MGISKEKAHEIWKNTLASTELAELMKKNQKAAQYTHLFRNKLFFFLYRPILARLKNKPDIWETAFSALQQDLLEKLNLDAKAQHLFVGDFEVFLHVIRVRLTPLNEQINRFELKSLWGNEVESPSVRYQEIICDLLTALVHELKDGQFEKMNLSKLQEVLDAIKPLSRLCLAEERVPIAEQAHVLGIRELLIQWLVQFTKWFRSVSKMKATVKDEEYWQTADKMWQLMMHFGLHRDAAYQEAMINLENAYRAGQLYYERKEYFFQNQSIHPVKGFFQKLTDESEISFLIDSLKADLGYLIRWNRYESRTALLGATRRQEGKGASYLAVYQSMQSRFSKLSEAAFNIRMQHEIKLRGKRDYLNLLGILDKKLIELDDESTKAKQGWMQEIEALFSEDSFYKQANVCFKALESARKLRYADWVHHTAYWHKKTEDHLADEMNARNRTRVTPQFETYGLKTSLTLSDYVVLHLAGYLKEAQRTAYLKVHPDRLSEFTEEEKGIGTYCSQVLEAWSQEAALMTYIWMQGQWRVTAPAHALPIEDGVVRVTVSHAVRQTVSESDVISVSEPVHALDLLALRLHYEHIEWMKDKENLRKQAKDVSYLRSLYSGDPENELMRSMFESGKRQFVRNINMIRKEKEETKRLLEEKKLLTQRIETFKQQAQTLEQKQAEGMRNHLRSGLIAQFRGAAAHSRGWVTEQIMLVITATYQTFFWLDKEEIQRVAYELMRTEPAFSHVNHLLDELPPPTPAQPIMTGVADSLRLHGTFTGPPGLSVSSAAQPSSSATTKH